MSETIWVVLNSLIMLILLGILYGMQKRYISFTKRVFVALGVGIVYGAVLQWIFGADSTVVRESSKWFNLIGTGYVKLLKMVVMPLIIVSIVSALANVEGSKGLGKKAGTIILTLIITTGIAAGVGIITATTFGLNAESMQMGADETARGQVLENRLDEVGEGDFTERLLEMIPENPFLDMTGARPTSTIGVVIFSAFLGIAIMQIKRKKPEEAETAVKMVRATHAVVMRIVTLVLRLTPFGVLALMTNVVAGTDIKGIISLGSFIVASYVAIGIMFLVHLLILFFFGYNPIQYIKKVIPVLTFAFTSRSSAGTIPLNINTQTDALGVSEELSSLSASFGATIGQNGCAGIYPAMLAVMIAPVMGINPLSPGFIVQLIVIIIITSFGVAGVGGGATFAALLVLSSLNFPVALAGLLISIEPLIDMARTALNVNGSMVSGLVAARAFKEVNMEVFLSDATAQNEA